MSFLSSSQKAIVDRIAGVVENVEARMMLGTIGLFAGGQQFGILDEEDVYLYVNDDNRARFANEGTEPYHAPDVEQAAYLEVPDGVVEDDERFAEWVQRAVEAAD